MVGYLTHFLDTNFLLRAVLERPFPGEHYKNTARYTVHTQRKSYQFLAIFATSIITGHWDQWSQYCEKMIEIIFNKTYHNCFIQDLATDDDYTLRQYCSLVDNGGELSVGIS